MIQIVLKKPKINIFCSLFEHKWISKKEFEVNIERFFHIKKHMIESFILLK